MYEYMSFMGVLSFADVTGEAEETPSCCVRTREQNACKLVGQNNNCQVHVMFDLHSKSHMHHGHVVSTIYL